MAEETQPTSIQARIAALKLNQVIGPPESPPPTYEQSITAKKARAPPPPPPTKRPAADPRRASTNNPPLQSNAPASSNSIGNQPAVLPAPQMGDLRADPSIKSKTPSLPSRPARKSSEQTPILPSRTNTGPSPALPPRTNTGISPSLPPRTNTGPSPSLPPRRPSEQINRRDSSESVSSTVSGISSISGISNRTSRTSGPQTCEAASNRVKAPIYDPTTLPSLPPKEKGDQKPPGRTPLKSTKSSPNIVAAAKSTANGLRRDLPPPLPTRQDSRDGEGAPQPVPLPKRSALSFGMNTESPPPLPAERSTNANANGISSPPPIPLSSRPDLAALQASKPKPLTGPIPGVCLKCRDFTAADTHAARFPRASLPNVSLSTLAHQLTAPFASSPTDQARTIFTWLHHNIAYNVDAFFSNSVQPSTPASTLQSGLAVCEGYAGLFTALATHAGLESLVIGGHGKGYGHSPLAPGAPVPPFSSGHAWNAVYLPDSGVPGGWKLIDCCWGAGVVSGAGQPYEPLFNSAQFTMDNDEFGRSHLPADRGRQYRADGREVPWEEYILADAGENKGPQMFDGYLEPEGIRRASFEPTRGRINVQRAPEGDVTRFRFGKVCAHWTYERNGKGRPYVFVLKAPGMGGAMRDFVAFETNGLDWWADVPTRQLGKPGESAEVFAVTSWDGKDGRGVTVEEFRRRQGTVGMGWAALAKYELV
ncbi:MAG: hypothetical protein Q9157_002498 [Trypethelium eluteriae]